jgi:hypothetical protein
MENKSDSEKAQVEGDDFGTGNTTTPTNEVISKSGVVEIDHAASCNVHIENGLSGEISQQHRDYLIARHGTTDLSPLPTMDPADPLNWPAWKVHTPSQMRSIKLTLIRKTLTCYSSLSMQ